MHLNIHTDRRHFRRQAIAEAIAVNATYGFLRVTVPTLALFGIPYGGDIYATFAEDTDSGGWYINLCDDDRHQGFRMRPWYSRPSEKERHHAASYYCHRRTLCKLLARDTAQQGSMKFPIARKPTIIDGTPWHRIVTEINLLE